MSKSIASIFGKPARRAVPYPKVDWVLPNCLTGLEIEVENTNETVHPEAYFPYWTRTTDGSLRSGCEYVLAMPLKGDTLSQAIHELYHGNTKFERTTTGSTHIHLDMTEESVTQNVVKLLVLLMYVFEGAVFAIADRGREWCGYTNKLTSAPESLIGSVLNASEDDQYFEFSQMCMDRQQVGRYYGINVMALSKYGSLEFRYFPTATSAEELIDWVNLVMNFRLAATELQSVDEFLSILENDERYDAFLTTYFSKWKDAFLQETPQYMALAQLRKALATASTLSFSRNKPSKFNEKAIINNKVLAAKYYIKRERNLTTPFIVVTPMRSCPTGDTQVPGTVMVHNDNRIYVSSGRDWMGYPFENYDRDGMRDIQVAALKSMRKHWTKLPQLCREAGIRPQNYEGAKSRLSQAIERLVDVLGLEWTPLEELEPYSPVPQVAVPPQARYTSSLFDNPFGNPVPTPAPEPDEPEEYDVGTPEPDYNDEGDDT